MVRIFSITFIEKADLALNFAGLRSVKDFIEGAFFALIGEEVKDLEFIEELKEFLDGQVLVKKINNNYSRFEILFFAIDEVKKFGASHALILNPFDIFPKEEIYFCRKILEETELRDSSIGIPPRQHNKKQDPEPTDGVLIRHLALKKIKPSRFSPYFGEIDENFFLKIINLKDLNFSPQKGIIEPNGNSIFSSPYTLYLPTTHFWDLKELGDIKDHLPKWVKFPEVIRDKRFKHTLIIKEWERNGYFV